MPARYIFTPPRQWDYMDHSPISGDNLLYSTDRIGIALAIETPVKDFDPNQIGHLATIDYLRKFSKCMTCMHKHGRYANLSEWCSIQAPKFAEAFNEPLVLLDVSTVRDVDVNDILGRSALPLRYYLNLFPIEIAEA